MAFRITTGQIHRYGASSAKHQPRSKLVRPWCYSPASSRCCRFPFYWALKLADDQLWYKYVYLEELLLNIPGARQIFERWMQWEPNDKAWQSYIKLEERYNELDRASMVYERWIGCRPIPKNWVIWAKFEEDRGRADKAREVFQTALEFFGDEEEQVEKAQAVFSSFAKMETRLKEFERARVIYKFALARLPRSKSASRECLVWYCGRTLLTSSVLGLH